MNRSVIQNKVIEEINLIPEERLAELYNFIRYFRIGLQKSQKNRENIMNFAGCWEDMSENDFNELTNNIKERRKKAFSRRKENESGND